MKKLIVPLVVAVAVGVSPSVMAQGGPRYEVEVTNLTRGQTFTPLLVLAHRGSAELFRVGAPAQPGLVTLAEEGNIMPLVSVFEGQPQVSDIATNGGLLAPGGAVRVMVEGHDTRDRITVAAMLIPTNDAFVALVDAKAPLRGDRVVLHAVAYDSGSERNDELCASIPGPSFLECGGPGGGGAPGGGEGYVHIHAGIHGTGDFAPADRDWRNPVAEIVITRVR